MGPLAGPAGEWNGEGGLDTAFSHSRNEVHATPYLADSWSYEETTMLQMNELPAPFVHTDRNTLRRVG